MDAVLHRIEALPGRGRYAVTFARPDGAEQTATVHVTENGAAPDVTVAEASLPTGWTRDGDAFRATAEAVLAVEAARRLVPSGTALADVDGGWDVSLGNVVLGPDGVPTCTAHGAMVAGESGGRFTCAECGAAALVS